MTSNQYGASKESVNTPSDLNNSEEDASLRNYDSSGLTRFWNQNYKYIRLILPLLLVLTLIYVIIWLTAKDSCPPLDFEEIALRYKTDKVNPHLYQNVYSKYLPPVRCQPLRILEIGLGCGMPYGVGASYDLWLEYFPNAEIFFIEFDEECAKPFMNKNPRVKMFIGDQADRNFLNEFLGKSGGRFDFIIDDGGHGMNQQITSLEVLFPAVKPGGIYFLEDLLTSFETGREDGHGAPEGTTVAYIKELIDDFMTRNAQLQPPRKPISNLMKIIECIDELCAFTKK
jgi:hypothetical protein